MGNFFSQFIRLLPIGIQQVWRIIRRGHQLTPSMCRPFPNFLMNLGLN